MINMKEIYSRCDNHKGELDIINIKVSSILLTLRRARYEQHEGELKIINMKVSQM